MSEACPSEDLLGGFLEGALHGDPLSKVESHLLHCGECRKLVAASAGATPAAPPFAAGALIGRYRIEGVLGAGGMGVVYAAHDPELGRRIALKVLREAPERVLIEARAMARLSHPNVVGVHDVLTADGRVLIAMELIEGVTLRQWLRKPRGWREALDVLLQAARGIAAAHGAGVIHRDFKPDNVLVRSDGRAFVTDFGLARLAEDPVGGIAGSPAYMAPEQMRGEPAGERADLFAFCVAAHEAVFGARPFAGSTQQEVEENVLRQRFRAPPRTSPRRLRAAIVRGLAADPAKRPASMNALIEELQKTERALRRRPVAIVAGAMAVVTAVAALLAARAAAAARWRPELSAMQPVYDEDASFPAWSPDGRFIAYGSNRDGWPRLFVAPASGGPPRALTPPGMRALSARWTADGSAITFIDDQNRVYRMPAAGGEAKLLASGPRAFADCGGRLVYSVRGAPGCLDCPRLVEGDRVLLELPSSARINDVRCDRDGRRLAISRTDLVQDHETAALFLLPFEGGEPRRLTGGDVFDCNPTFHPDGRSVVFTRWLAGRADLWEVGAEGGEPHQLTFSDGSDEQLGADVSPDGSRVVFITERRRDVLVAWNGSARTEVTAALDSISGFALSPDGRAIVAEVREFGAAERTTALKAIALDTKEETVLVPGGRRPAFTPQGDLVYSIGHTLWIHPRGGAPRPLAELPGVPRAINAGPDSVYAAVLSGQGGRSVVEVPLSGGASRRSIAALSVVPAPRGELVAVQMARPDGRWEGRLIAPGSADRPLATVTARSLAWDADGASLVHSDGLEMRRYFLHGGADVPLFRMAIESYWVQVSPDGRTVYTLEETAQGVRRLITNFASRPQPLFGFGG